MTAPGYRLWTSCSAVRRRWVVSCTSHNWFRDHNVMLQCLWTEIWMAHAVSVQDTLEHAKATEVCKSRY